MKDLLLELLEKSPILLFIGSVIYVWWLVDAKHEHNVINGSPENPAFKRRVKRLRKSSPQDIYLSSLRNLIERINGVLKDKPKETNDSSNAFLHKHIGVEPWTAKSFGFILKLAVLYPIAFLLIGWLFFNYGKLGSLEVLPTITSKYTIVAFGERAVILALLSFCAFSFYTGIKTKGWKLSLVWYAVAFIVAVVFSIIALFFKVIAISFTVASASIFAFIFLKSKTFAGTIVVSVSSAFAITVFSINYNITTSILLFISAIISHFILILILNKYHSFQKNKASFWFISWFILLAYLLGSIYLITNFNKLNSIINDSLIMILFLGILPLFNAPLDWLSLGFTRGLLQAIADKKHSTKGIIFMLILDLIVAIIFLVLVTVSSLLGIFLMNTVSGVEVINLSDIFAQLRNGDWKESLWIWLMLGSTLIPTIVHFYFVIYALLVSFFTSKRLKEAADQLQKSIDNPEIPQDSDAVRVAFFAIVLNKLMASILAFSACFGISCCYVYFLLQLL